MFAFLSRFLPFPFSKPLDLRIECCLLPSCLLKAKADLNAFNIFKIGGREGEGEDVIKMSNKNQKEKKKRMGTFILSIRALDELPRFQLRSADRMNFLPPPSLPIRFLNSGFSTFPLLNKRTVLHR